MGAGAQPERAHEIAEDDEARTIKPVPSETATTNDTSASTQMLGDVYLPAAGTPVGQFEFLVDDERGLSVQIGTPVTAETREGSVIGAVIDMRTVGTARDPISVDVAGGYDRDFVSKGHEVMVATVQVFHSQALRPIRAGRVRAATAPEMLDATGYHRMDWTVPAGVVPLADGSFAKVCTDGAALLGPEAAHLIVSGLSGQAAKSSYAGTLLRSALHHGGAPGHAVGALIFNVKGEDLIWIDQPPASGKELAAIDREIYAALGTPATPFEDVTVYAPGMPGGSGSHSPRQDAALLRWDLVQLWPYLRFLFPWLNEDEKAQSFFAEFRELVLNTRSSERVDTFAKLDDWFRTKIADADESGSSMAWRSHHVATVRRIWRMLSSLPARGLGLFSKESAKPGEDVPDTGWHHGQVVVVDIAPLPADMRSVVVARTVERLLKRAEAGELGVDHLVILADELNEFAPAQGGEMATLRRQLEKVATQGRYAGLSLWGMCQSASKIDPLIRDNAATRALGVTTEAELASGAYGRLSGGLLERIATLPKGQIALSHYSFRAPLVVQFPRPAWRTGKATTSGASRPTLRSVLREHLSERALERATEGLSGDQVEALVAQADGGEDAVAALLAERTIDMRRAALHEPTTFDAEDPFDLGDLEGTSAE